MLERLATVSRLSAAALVAGLVLPRLWGEPSPPEQAASLQSYDVPLLELVEGGAKKGLSLSGGSTFEGRGGVVAAGGAEVVTGEAADPRGAPSGGQARSAASRGLPAGKETGVSHDVPLVDLDPPSKAEGVSRVALARDSGKSGEVTVNSAESGVVAGSAVEAAGEKSESLLGPSSPEGQPSVVPEAPEAPRGGDVRLAEMEAADRAAAESAGYPEGMPISEAEVDSWRGGYFPTQDDSVYIGDRDYPRSKRGFGSTQPDLYSQNFTGIFPYESPDETFYDRHDYIFDPLDQALGVFAPHDGFVWEGDQYHELSFVADAGFDIFTRSFDPDRAHVKAGPLYLDLLSVGAGILYSDYSGPENFAEGEEDGWLSMVDLHLRAVMQLSETFYLIVTGQLIYLPGKNEFGLRFGDGYGPYSIARLNYQTRIEEWDFQIYDAFRARFGGDLFWGADEPAYERAGRYYFGFDYGYDRDGRNNSFFDDDYVSFANTVGVRASRPLGSEWRLWLEGDHSDYWRTYDFTDHTYWDHVGALIGYEGSRIPFSPYLEYDAHSNDHFDTSYHTAYLGGRGRLSENLRLNARGGRLWTVDVEPESNSWVWDATLTHDVNERTWQSLSVGQTYVVDDFSDESALAEYLRYEVGYRLTDWIYARGYAQWSEDEFLTGRGGTWERELYGGGLSIRPLDYTYIGAGANFERTRQLPDGDEEERRLYYVSLTQRLYSRTSLWFRYQFEETDTFNEHLYSAGMRRYF